jgi:hypothetical protein
MEPWELAARERIRDSLALYNWSGDAFRLDELARAFCEDGELEIRGQQSVRGRDAIVAYLGHTVSMPNEVAAASGVKRIVRHNLTNVHFLELTPEHALVATYFTVLTEIGLDHYGRYRDRFVAIGDEWLIRHRFVSVDWRAPESTMAPQPNEGR